MTYFSELFFADDYLRRKSSRPNVRVISSLIDLCSRSAVHDSTVQCSAVQCMHACMYAASHATPYQIARARPRMNFA